MMAARDDKFNRAQLKRERIQIRQRFIKARMAERSYARQLRRIAEQVGVIVRGMAPNGFVENMAQIRNALSRYSEMLHPWAKAVAGRMIGEVARRDEQAWIELGNEMGRALKSEIRTAPTGAAMKELLEEQVNLITSLPLKAAERVHELTIRQLSNQGRAAEMAKEIMRTSEVTKSRATLIARTETSRTVSAMTEVRARHVGAEQYIWRTALDSDVRPLHAKLEGKVFSWDDPPVIGENGERGAPGSIYNCRCYAEPIIEDD